MVPMPLDLLSLVGVVLPVQAIGYCLVHRLAYCLRLGQPLLEGQGIPLLHRLLRLTLL